MFTVDVKQQYNNNNNTIIFKTRILTFQQVSQGSWVRYPVWQHTFVSPSAFSRRAVVSYWRKYVHEVLVNRLGGLSLPRKSVVRLTDRPDMTLDVYRGRKTTKQTNKTFQQATCVKGDNTNCFCFQGLKRPHSFGAIFGYWRVKFGGLISP